VYAPEHPGTSPGDPRAIDEVRTFWELMLVYERADPRARPLSARVAVGASYGGMVAADLAATFPRLFSRLVLLAPAGLWRDEAPIPVVEMVVRAAGAAAEVPVRAPRGPGCPGDHGAACRPGADSPQRSRSRHGTSGASTKFAWPIADHGLGRRHAPGRRSNACRLGRQDALVPVAYAAEFGRSIAGSQVEIIDDCGHVMQTDQPEAVWTVVSKFLSA